MTAILIFLINVAVFLGVSTAFYKITLKTRYALLTIWVMAYLILSYLVLFPLYDVTLDVFRANGVEVLLSVHGNAIMILLILCGCVVTALINITVVSTKKVKSRLGMYTNSSGRNELVSLPPNTTNGTQESK
jgi:hypothetical protein